MSVDLEFAPKHKRPATEPCCEPVADPDMAAWTGCVAGALTKADLREQLAAAGFADVEVRETHRVHTKAGSATIRARMPKHG